jgi:small subunit ribosomal protein S13
MARISGIDLPKEKRIETALNYIYGIGPSLSKKILVKANVNADIRVKNLKDDEVGRIQTAINSENIKVEGDLRREVSLNIKRLIDVGTFRGSRHRKGLPVRGQRTKTNARTRKGPKKTAGSGRKKEE